MPDVRMIFDGDLNVGLDAEVKMKIRGVERRFVVRTIRETRLKTQANQNPSFTTEVEMDIVE